MNLGRFYFGFILAAALPAALAATVSVPLEVLAEEATCVSPTFFGVDPAFEQAVLEQLRNELDVPIAGGESSPSCRRLIIEIRGEVARILLTGTRVFETKLNLNEVPEAHRPRALALSSAGLWALSEPLSESDGKTRNSTEAPMRTAPSKPSNGISSKRETQDKTSRERRPSSKRDSDESKETRRSETRRSETRRSDSSNVRIRFRFPVEGRLIPKYWAWTTELLPGIGIQFGNFYLDIAAVGLFGRKSSDIGHIFTAGFGLRLSVWLQALRKKSFVMRVGPAAEILGVFGYGREKEGARAYQAFEPVTDILFQIGGWFALSPRIDTSIALGGGFTALYFQMKANGKPVSGLEGGIAVLSVGLDFDL